MPASTQLDQFLSDTAMRLMASGKWWGCVAGLGIGRVRKIDALTPRMIELLDHEFVWRWERNGKRMEERTIVQHAIWTIGEVKDPRSITPLIQTYCRPIENQSRVRDLIRKALTSMGKESVAAEWAESAHALTPEERRLGEELLTGLGMKP